MTDIPQPESVAASVITTSAKPNTYYQTVQAVPGTFISTESSKPETYKVKATAELAKIKASVADMESYLENIPGEVSDQVSSAINRLESYGKKSESVINMAAVVRDVVILIASVVFIIFIVRKIF